MDTDHLGLKRLSECLDIVPRRKILFQRMEKDTIDTILLPTKALIRLGRDM